ncbi:MAG: 2'-5' RNA ligase [Cyclobacteriaceae bacterium]
MSNQNLYFISIVPPDPTNGKISQLKEEVAFRWNVRHALRSPPHITLHMPFRWRADRMQGLYQSLEQEAASISKFPLFLDGFDAFEPRVVFVNVIENESLANSQKRITKAMRKHNILNSGYKDRPFHPHITIAFRDVKKPVFEEIWNDFRQRDFKEGFIAEKLSLLKYEDNQWVVDREFSFA